MIDREGPPVSELINPASYAGEHNRDPIEGTYERLVPLRRPLYTNLLLGVVVKQKS